MIYIDPPYNTGNDFVYNDDFARTAAEEDLEAGNVDELGLRDRKNTDSNGKFHSDWCSMIYSRLLVARSLLTEDGVIFISIDDNEVLRDRKNTDSNGKFHSDWCSMIYSRLLVARSLLTEDGVIFISIDDNEVRNLRNICDEVFGESNYISTLVWERAFSPKNDAKYISNSHDYIVMYAKSIDNFTIGRLPRTEEANARYSNPDNDPRGPWMSSDISVKTYNAACDFPITTPSGRTVEPPAGRCWSLSAKAFAERLQDNRIWFGPNGDNTPRIKRFLSELKFDGMAPTSILFYKEVGHSQEGAQEVVSLFGDKGVFDGPKPVRLMQRLITLANLNEDSIVLDFFSGSASTAHALMKTNAEKDSHCRFIMVQLPEEVSDTKKNQDYDTIPEIGKERIRRAGKKIKEENPLTTQHLDTGFRVFRLDESNYLEVKKSPKEYDQDMLGLFVDNIKADRTDLTQHLDTGFRVFRLDESNYLEVKKSPKEYDQDMLGLFVDNIKADRTDLDLLFGSMLAWGVQLDMPMTTEQVDGCTVYTVNEGDLVACFSEPITDKVIQTMADKMPLVQLDMPMTTEQVDGCTVYTVNEGDLVACFSEPITDKVIQTMADKMPLRILFRDSCFTDDAQKINIYEQFKQLLDWADDEAFKNIKVI